MGNELVSVVQILSLVIGISPDIVGVTVVAWGNSVGDLVADVAAAKKGYANMGMTACFAGPIFNLIIGLGIGFLQPVMGISRPYPVSLSGVNLLSFSFKGAVLLLSAGVSIYYKGRLPRRYAYVLLAVYALFMLLAVL